MGCMIDVLKKFFRPGAAVVNEPRPEVAVAALLIEAARADGVYATAERGAVLALLCEMFDLDPGGAEQLCAEGETAQEQAPDLVRFTRIVKNALDEGERQRLMEGLWQVVLVDHHRDPHEDALLRRLPPLIALSDHDNARARRTVLARLSAPS